MGAGPPAYPPADLDQPDATLTMHRGETPTGVEERTCRRAADATGRLPTAAPRRFPARPIRARALSARTGSIRRGCTSWSTPRRDPLVLGIGLAATRDIVSFFRYAARGCAAARRTRSPARSSTRSAIGDSQSGNFIKTFIHLGFNEDLARPHRLGRRVPADRRAADADELPLRAAGRRRRRSTSRAASRVVWWGALRRHDARPCRRRACSIAAPPRRPVRRSSRRSDRRSSGGCACRRG